MVGVLCSYPSVESRVAPSANESCRARSPRRGPLELSPAPAQCDALSELLGNRRQTRGDAETRPQSPERSAVTRVWLRHSYCGEPMLDRHAQLGDERAFWLLARPAPRARTLRSCRTCSTAVRGAPREEAAPARSRAFHPRATRWRRPPPPPAMRAARARARQRRAHARARAVGKEYRELAL
jgi:hypothetical protein